jgi:hypothetical protein
LFYAVFEWCQAKLLEDSVAELRETKGALEGIVAFAEATVGALIANVDLYPVTLEVWAAAKTGTRKRFAMAMQMLYVNYRGRTAALIRATRESGEIKPDADPDALASVLVGAVDGMLLQCWLDPAIDAKTLVRTFLHSLFEGIEVRERRQER